VKTLLGLNLINDSIDVWPCIDLDSLTSSDREKYKQRCIAVKMLLEGRPLDEIQEKSNIKASSIYYYLNRCKELGSDGQILGFRALLPRRHLVPYTRIKSESPKLPEAQGGCSGLFVALLDRFPDIEQELLARIRKEQSRSAIHEHRIRPKTLHGIFISLLKEKGIADGEWPFNTKWQGRTTIYKYMRKILLAEPALTATRRGDNEARNNIHLGRKSKSLIRCEQPYEIFEVDAHRIDCHATVSFSTPNGTKTEILMKRMWIIALLCRASSAIISCRVVYRSEVGADDIVALLRDAINPEHTRPKAVIEGLIYPQHGGLPKEVIPECRGALWSAIMFDGALAHLAIKVRERARRELGFSINWGSPGVPARRSRIEHFFNVISKELFQRLVSTTGSSPSKGRARRGAELAVAYDIAAEEIEHLLSVCIAVHNVTPSEALFNISPLDYIKQKIDLSGGELLFRYMPIYKYSEGIEPFCDEKIVTVRGDVKKGRMPYIQYQGVRYTNSILRDSAELISKKIKIVVNESDLRVRAFTINGYPLDILVATGKWSHTKHDLRTRKAILSLLSARTVFVNSQQDPIQVYLSYLSTKMVNRKGKPAISASQATEAKRVSKEADLELIMREEEIADEVLMEVNHHTEPVGSKSMLNKPLPNLAKILKGGG
jgi:putative transposase